MRTIALTLLAAALLCARSAAQHDHSKEPQKAPDAAPAAAPADPQKKTEPVDHSKMDHSQHAAPATPAQPDNKPEFFRGKKYSEFSHRMAGVFVILAGLFYMLSDRLARRWPAVKYAWPLCLLVPGIYLIFFSDPKWPFGPKGFLELLQTNTEFMQHKIYSTILISLGLFELARTRGAIRGTWSIFVFPSLGIIGALLLLIHPHGAGEHSPEHLAAMASIQNQHLLYTIVGCGIALAKALSELSWSANRIFVRVWPALMLVLGVMLVFYSE